MKESPDGTPMGYSELSCFISPVTIMVCTWANGLFHYMWRRRYPPWTSHTTVGLLAKRFLCRSKDGTWEACSVCLDQRIRYHTPIHYMADISRIKE